MPHLLLRTTGTELSVRDARLARTMNHVETGALRTPLEQRLAALRGSAPQRSLDARALAALAANPGCRRRAVLDAAGVDKAALAGRLGHPAPFGQSPFAIARGLSFEKRITSDGFADLLELLRRHLAPAAAYGSDDDCPVEVPQLVTDPKRPAERVASTRAALARASRTPGVWTLLHHPLLRLEVAGSTVLLEPDVIAVRPDGRWTVVEIKSFPILDGGADPAKVGAAARQAAVYVLALRATAAELDAEAADKQAADKKVVSQETAGKPEDDTFRDGPGALREPFDPYLEPEGLAGAPSGTVLLVCPKDFSNRPTAATVDVRKPMAVTRRQLDRLTRIEELLDALPPGSSFDLAPDRADSELGSTVAAVGAAYSPDCLASCELAFHCRAEARCAGAVETLGRGVRGELGSLRTVDEALAAAQGTASAAPAHSAVTEQGPVVTEQGSAVTEEAFAVAEEAFAVADEAVARLAHAAALRAEALACAVPNRVHSPDGGPEA